MFKKLQKKLTFLYTLTTGTILTVILIICFFYMKTAVEARYKAEFSDIFLTISNRFQTESFFTDSWLAQMESDNHLLIHIEENGKPLFFQGAFSPDTKRDVLLENARKKAADMGITLQAATFSSPLQTSAFTVKGNANDSYLCMYLVEAGISGGKSLHDKQAFPAVNPCLSCRMSVPFPDNCCGRYASFFSPESQGLFYFIWRAGIQWEKR